MYHLFNFQFLGKLHEIVFGDSEESYTDTLDYRMELLNKITSWKWELNQLKVNI